MEELADSEETLDKNDTEKEVLDAVGTDIKDVEQNVQSTSSSKAVAREQQVVPDEQEAVAKEQDVLVEEQEAVALEQDVLAEEQEAVVEGHETVAEEQEAGSFLQNSEANALPHVEYSFHNICEMAKFWSPSNKYFIGCKWSPDGTCLLTNCADYTLRILDLPQEFHGLTEWSGDNESKELLKPALQMKEGGLIYDYDWYPFMSSWSPPTCCFIATSAGSPVHLWDAYTGEIRASYRAYDFADEVHAAVSLTFSTNGEDIYCGFRNLVKVFDVSKPGRQYETFNLKGISGHKGIVSCIAENPTVPSLFAVGTFNKSIGLYTRSNEFVCMLNGQKSGLTQLKFSEDGSKLFSGARMDNEIIGWDIRNLGKVLFSLERVVNTNQRIYFDLTKDYNYLISGGTDGKLRIYDIYETNLKCDMKYLFDASNDCINGVSVHSSLPIIATSSGQKHNPEITNDDGDEVMFSFDSDAADNSIKLWWTGPTSTEDCSEAMNVDAEPT